ncbi:MAG: hypothetical protein V4676_11335 [Bacteroidota bacterium]
MILEFEVDCSAFEHWQLAQIRPSDIYLPGFNGSESFGGQLNTERQTQDCATKAKSRGGMDFL